MMKFLKKAPMAAGVAMALASGGAQANFSGIDLNLTANAAAGGMAGAAYVRPEEPTAAIFGNPATLTQFKGFNVNFGAAIARVNATNKQEYTHPTGTYFTNKSDSDADNYVAPNFGITMELAKGFVIGLGFEADGGLGADYRDDPVMLLAGAAAALNAGGVNGGVAGNIPYAAGEAASLPLVVEFLSFNANLAAGYEVTEKLSVGVSGTIGFGLLQFGTAGPTTGITFAGTLLPAPFTGALTDFGGTSASVHDVGFGASLGATYAVTDQIMVGAAVKSKLEYNFRKLTHSTLAPGDGWQDAKLQAPMEIIVGVAFDDVFLPNLLVEADVVWKNWDDAALVQDIWEDQFMVALGARYTMDKWKFRLGYQWSQPQQTPATDRSDIAHYAGVGTLPLKNGAPPVGALVGADVMGIIQTTLTPVIIEHTITAGIGYNFTDAVRVDAYASYGFPEEESRYTPTLNSLLAGGLPATKFTADVSIHVFGVGINVAMP